VIISGAVLLRMRKVSDKCVEKIKTHILCAVTFLKSRVVYEIMWKSMVQTDRQTTDDNIVLCVPIAYRINNSTKTHTQNRSV